MLCINLWNISFGKYAAMLIQWDVVFSSADNVLNITFNYTHCILFLIVAQAVLKLSMLRVLVYRKSLKHSASYLNITY